MTRQNVIYIFSMLKYFRHKDTNAAYMFNSYIIYIKLRRRSVIRFVVDIYYYNLITLLLYVITCRCDLFLFFISRVLHRYLVHTFRHVLSEEEERRGRKARKVWFFILFYIFSGTYIQTHIIITYLLVTLIHRDILTLYESHSCV